MKQGKETKSKEVVSRDPEITGFSYDEFFNNRLSLPDSIKEKLKAEGLDWRFINAAQFRQDGGIHKSHWRPYKASGEIATTQGVNAEGFIQRGDLLLAVREKKISKMHRSFLDQRNQRLKGINKQQADEFRQRIREEGRSGQVKVVEGYGSDEE